MRRRALRRRALVLLLLAASPAPLRADSAWGLGRPWREAGLTERQAAACLLDRFAYGPRPGEVDAVVALGLGNWIEGQLAGDLPGPVLAARLSRLPAIPLSPTQIVRRYSNRRYSVAQEAIAAGVISREDYSGRRGDRRLQQAVAALDRFAADRGTEFESQLLDQLKAQKLWRAVDSQTRLVEVLTDFWLNHFNVTASGAPTVHLLSYERDAIRPNVLATFRRLLGATARHPAILTYLDNARSVADRRATTTFDLEVQELDRLSPLDNPTLRRKLAQALGWGSRRRAATPRGLNENYARELLELHTLGLDGGYTQGDVVEVARAFTGWSTFPPGGAREWLEGALVTGDTAAAAAGMGFVVEGEFVFRADQHDSEPKTVLGVELAPGRGIEDGEEVLDLIARHPSTVRHLARKLAVRFVSEQPPAALVERLVERWELTDGDLRQVLRALLESPELWEAAARRTRVKSPFELAVSALRALDAEVSDPRATLRWIARMGQPVYGYAAPTGFPDRGDTWTQVGPLLARVNFALELSRDRIAGVTLDLLELAGRRRPRSLEEAVEIFFPRLMPGRDPTLVFELIAPPAPEDSPRPAPGGDEPPPSPEASRRSREHAVHAVGMLIGSPEFQVH